MTFSSIVFLSLFFLFQQCLAVAVRLQQRDSTYDVASTLVVTATAGDQAVVTFYPSRISDPAFWTLSTPTTTISPSSTRVIGPLGYEWVALPSVVSPPAIPIDAPYPIPGNITTTFFQSPSGSDLLPSATEISISAPLKTITRGNTPQLSNASHETRGSAIFTGTTPATSLSNSIPFKTVVSSIPILSSARSNGEVFSSIGSFSSSNDFGGVSSINFSLTPASSNSFPLPTDDKPSSVPLSSGAGSTRSIPWFTGSNSNSILPPTSLGSTRSIPLGTGRSSIPLSSLGSAPQTIPQETDASSSRVFSQPVISSNSNRPGTGTSSGSIFSPTGIPSTSVRLGTGVTSPTPLSHLTASTTLSDASPSTAVSTDTSVSNGVSSASVGYSSAPVSGAFSATPTEPTQAFPSYEAPTGVVTGVAATSEAAQLSGLFFAIYANRDHITDSNLKQHYIDSVRKTKEETDALFNALDVKPEADPACLNTKRRRHIISERKLRLLIRKRSLISGITDLVGDAAKLLSCATKVVDNLVKAVEAPVPPISEIEVLTDTLNDIGEDLKKEDESPSNSPSATQPSATQETTTQESTASSTASSCKVSSAIPRCTETVTLSTSFISGTPTVQALTTEVCTTITACGESASTVFTTVSTGTSTGGIVCATSCVECANPVVKRSGPLYERSLDDPNDFDSNNQYVLEQSWFIFIRICMF